MIEDSVSNDFEVFPVVPNFEMFVNASPRQVNADDAVLEVSESEDPEREQPIAAADGTRNLNCNPGTADNITIVEIVHNTKGQVVRNKCQACYFCGEPQSHLVRHLQRRHKTEPQVVQLMAADTRSRATRIIYLRNLGNFSHNTKVMKEKSGKLIVAKRSKGRKPDEYVPCTHCFAMYVESDLWRHIKSCPFRTHIADDVLPAQTDVVENGRMLLFGAVENKELDIDVDPDLKATVIDHMRPGVILDVVTKDALILRFGSAILRRSGPTRSKLVAQRMRQIARLKIEVNKDPNLGPDLQRILRCVI